MLDMLSTYLTCFIFHFQCKYHFQDILSDQYVDYLNKLQNKWKAERSFHPQTPIEDIKLLMGTKKSGYEFRMSKFPRKYSAEEINSLPDYFDASENWPECSSIKENYDQGKCGSCWAVAAVTAMSDRICIFSGGSKEVRLSVEDALSCLVTDRGCRGGSPLNVWKFWREQGIVSGGCYNSRIGCKPYSIPDCGFNYDENISECSTPSDIDTPTCNQVCQQGYSVSYDSDKIFAKEIYYLRGEDDIRAEILKNGPVEASFHAYSDFVNYKSGVYQQTSVNYLGCHSVKIIGWGVEDGEKYWLAMNSWFPQWGMEGMFKFLRGVNQGGIESCVFAGLPDL